MKVPVVIALVIVGLSLLFFGWWHGDQQFTVLGQYCSSAFQPIPSATAGAEGCRQVGQAKLMEAGLAIGVGASSVLAAIIVSQMPSGRRLRAADSN